MVVKKSFFLALRASELAAGYFIFERGLALDLDDISSALDYFYAFKTLSFTSRVEFGIQKYNFCSVIKISG